MTRAHVGLGSNLGDRMAILDTAVRVLDADEHTHVMAVSRVYETAPVGGPEQGPYLNAVAVLETDRSPHELLELLLATNVFRRDRGRWRMVLHHGSPVLRP